MSIHVLKFDTAGTGHCLYTEVLDLNSIGSLQMQRATNIEFNQRTQQWEVKDLQEKILFSNASRSVCLAWEHQKFNR